MKKPKAGACLRLFCALFNKSLVLKKLHPYRTEQTEKQERKCATESPLCFEVLGEFNIGQIGCSVQCGVGVTQIYIDFCEINWKRFFIVN